MEKIWRQRRCAQCGAVASAGTFAVVKASPFDDSGRRRCPSCGFTGAAHDFPIVAFLKGGKNVGKGAVNHGR